MKMKNSARGFTVLELCIAVAVILVIAAILVPVLTKAKNAARRTSCVSNMRQMFTAIEIYCSDYGGWSAPPNSVAELAGYISDESIFKCPSENVLMPDAAGTWKEALYYWEHPGRLPFRNSYSYVRTDPPNETQEAWDRLVTSDTVGILACIWHGVKKKDASPESLAVGIGPHFDAPILRICFDGRLYVRSKREVPGIWAPDDTYYLPWDRWKYHPNAQR